MLSSRVTLMGKEREGFHLERDAYRACTSRAQAGNLMSADFLAIN